jgi:hypothetical protein
MLSRQVAQYSTQALALFKGAGVVAVTSDVSTEGGVVVAVGPGPGAALFRVSASGDVVSLGGLEVRVLPSILYSVVPSGLAIVSTSEVFCGGSRLADSDAGTLADNSQGKFIMTPSCKPEWFVCFHDYHAF